MTDGRGLKLIGFLRNLTRYLESGALFFRAEIEETLRGIQQNLITVSAQYEAEGPEDTEAIRACMLETLDLFHSAVDDLFAFLANGDRAHPARRLLKALASDELRRQEGEARAQVADGSDAALQQALRSYYGRLLSLAWPDENTDRLVDIFL